jgi:hypothetical protein
MAAKSYSVEEKELQLNNLSCSVHSHLDLQEKARSTVNEDTI